MYMSGITTTLSTEIGDPTRDFPGAATHIEIIRTPSPWARSVGRLYAEVATEVGSYGHSRLDRRLLRMRLN